jgi:cytochrome c553
VRRRAPFGLGAAAAALLTGAAATQPGAPGQSPAPAAVQQPLAARVVPDAGQGRLIAEQGTAAGAAPCSACHGMDGTGTGTDAIPRLDGQSAYYLFKQLGDYASGLRQNEVMTPIAQSLEEAERQHAAAWYGAQRFAGTPAPGTPAAPARDEAAMRLGAGIVSVGIAERGVQACANCHGPHAAGLDPAAPRLAGQWGAYARAQFEAFRAGARRNDVAAVMRGLSHRLGDAEIAAVSDYLEALQPKQDR